MSGELTELTVGSARDGLERGNFTSRELTEAHLAAIDGAAALNAFILPTPDRALADADASDARRAKGDAGAMDGNHAKIGQSVQQGRRDVARTQQDTLGALRVSTEWDLLTGQLAGDTWNIPGDIDERNRETFSALSLDGFAARELSLAGQAGGSLWKVGLMTYFRIS